MGVPSGELGEWWGQMHAQLSDGYRDCAGVELESCERVARQANALLRRAGHLGEKHVIYPVPEIADPGSVASLAPKPYAGRVLWMCHVVCVAARVAYDPMLAEPMVLGDYLDEAFDRPVDMYRIGWQRHELNQQDCWPVSSGLAKGVILE